MQHPAYFWLGCMFFATSMAITNNLHIFINHGNILFYHFALFVNLAWGAYLTLFINSLINKSEKKNHVDWKLFIPALLYFPFIILCLVDPQWGVDSITLAKQIGNIAIDAVKDEDDSETLIFIMKAMIEREF